MTNDILKNMFQYILDNYLKTDNKVSNASFLYKQLTYSIPMFFKQITSRKDLRFKGSMGQGNRTDYPWISIINANISTSTKYGLYIVYLFKKDMSGFYLTLDQGITFFSDNFGREKYKTAQKIVKYFQDKIDDDYFSKHLIDLGGTKKGSLGYGYEQTVIISKFYKSHNFSDELLINDFNKMLKIYDEIYQNMDTDSYNEIIERILLSLKSKKDHLVLADDAISQIRQSLAPIDGLPYDFSKQLKEVKPYVDMSTKYKEITNPQIRKIDYVKKAKREVEIGYYGELLVLEYEKQRLRDNAILSPYSDKIEHVSVKSDGFGYDIVSYDLINGKVMPIYIEAKTTSNKLDIEFLVSKGEVDQSKTLKKQYCLYRVYDVLKNPKFYRVFGEIPQHFYLDPITYLAKYKG